MALLSWMGWLHQIKSYNDHVIPFLMDSLIRFLLQTHLLNIQYMQLLLSSWVGTRTHIEHNWESKLIRKQEEEGFMLIGGNGYCCGSDTQFSDSLTGSAGTYLFLWQPFYRQTKLWNCISNFTIKFPPSTQLNQPTTLTKLSVYNVWNDT